MSFKFSSVTGINFRKLIFYYFIISILTLLILFPDLVFFMRNNVINYAISGFVIVQLLLLVPVFFFSKMLRVYYWILAILVAFIPIMLMSVMYMNIQVNAEMVGLVLDTSVDEVTELLGWKIVLMVLAMAFCFFVFIKLSYRLPSKISWKRGLIISLIGLLSYLVIPLIRTTDMRYYSSILKNTYRTFYPFRLQSVFGLLHEELTNVKRYKEATKDFTFHAVNKDTTDHQRRILILVLGEASRADHWHINGYQRETSPEIEKLNDLISYKNVVSGGTMTIISIPLLITRATPDAYNRHTKEKSILAAFKEAGYYTAWISNQSHYGLSGNIGMHFSDGDTAIYISHGENETNFTGTYDQSILPVLSNIIKSHNDKNIFLIVHLIGSHWRYILRYPPAFGKFKPTASRNQLNMINPTKEEIINEYDNSVLYTDYILKSIADTLQKFDAESGFLFVSDHGENLNDKNDNTYFHSYKPTRYTAEVPLFIWLNDVYIRNNPQIFQALKSNQDKKISSALSVFYTMVDLGKISIQGFDSTASLADQSLVEPGRIILGDAGKIYHYKDLE